MFCDSNGQKAEKETDPKFLIRTRDKKNCAGVPADGRAQLCPKTCPTFWFERSTKKLRRRPSGRGAQVCPKTCSTFLFEGLIKNCADVLVDGGEQLCPK
jgi:hypothetical protein